MKYFVLMILLLSHRAFSQSFAERELITTIDEVTIYLQGGLITRTGKLEIPSGKSMLKLSSLSPHIDDKSIQLKATGDFTILSVNHKLNYLNSMEKDERIAQLNKEIESFELERATAESRLQILSEKESLLDENKNLGGQTSGASLTQIKQAIEFYDRELTAIKSDEIDTKLKIKELDKKISSIGQEISSVHRKDELPTGEIEIRIDAKINSSAEFKITYLVANTGWYPKYDVRVSSLEKPLELEYKADVYQNTGVNWENVKLKLSNGNPNQSGVAPELETWHLNYARNTYLNSAYGLVSNRVRNVSGKILSENGEPLRGANILIKGTTVGTVADSEGNYSLTLPNGATHLLVSFIGYSSRELSISSSKINVKLAADVTELSEVVAADRGFSDQLQGQAAGIRIRGNPSIIAQKSEVMTVSTIENQTTFEFEVDRPYSVKSNGEKLSVDLNSYEIETIYEYYAVPKLDKEAFLIARISNWDQYNLLEGEANLYFEDAYVGRSILDARSLEDTLNISLGTDKSIVIGREKIDEFSTRRTIGSNKIESRGFKIIVRNKKSQPIKLILFDQIPIAAISDITVSAENLSNGKLNEKTGEIRWKLHLKPLEQKELNLSYEVKYPKDEKVILE